EEGAAVLGVDPADELALASLPEAKGHRAVGGPLLPPGAGHRGAAAHAVAIDRGLQGVAAGAEDAGLEVLDAAGAKAGAFLVGLSAARAGHLRHGGHMVRRTGPHWPGDPRASPEGSAMTTACMQCAGSLQPGAAFCGHVAYRVLSGQWGFEGRGRRRRDRWGSRAQSAGAAATSKRTGAGALRCGGRSCGALTVCC